MQKQCILKMYQY